MELKKDIAPLQFITCDHPKYSHVQQVQIACESGVEWIQVRLKKQTEEEVREIAQQALTICREKGVRLILNDHVKIAAELGVDGVHVGRQDMHPDEARQLLGDQCIIGGTANNLQEVEDLLETSVDYIGFGPYRFTTTKENLSPVQGLEGMRMVIDYLVLNRREIPVIGIGGIQLEDIEGILDVGMSGIAISSSLVNAPNFADLTEQMKARLSVEKS